MNKIIIRASIFLSIFFFASASMCNKEEPNSQPEYTSLVGYWKLKGGNSFAIKDNGEQIITATLKEGVFANEFFADGNMIGHDLTGSLPSEKGAWKLEVQKLDDKDIEEGTLSIYTDYSKENAGTLFIDAEGSIKYNIATINNPSQGGKPHMYLTTKRYEVYPYKENWVYYIYEKQ